jgi:hypothetical protein
VDFFHVEYGYTTQEMMSPVLGTLPVETTLPFTTTPGMPYKFALHGAFPNPFNLMTSIRFDLPAAARATLEVFDVNGRKVSGSGTTPTTDGLYTAGSHSITFDGSNLPSGVYLYRLSAGQNTATGKMVLLK